MDSPRKSPELAMTKGEVYKEPFSLQWQRFYSYINNYNFKNEICTYNYKHTTQTTKHITSNHV